MLGHAHHRYGAAAVAATGGVRNVKPGQRHVGPSRLPPSQMMLTSSLSSGGKKNAASASSSSKKQSVKQSVALDRADTDTKTSSSSKSKDLPDSSTAASASSSCAPSTSSAGVATPSNAPENTTIDSSKDHGSVSAANSSSSFTPDALSQTSDDDIVIHVCDEARKVNRDFTCSKKLLLKEMKYFESYLSASNQYDDIDISVHCDVYIFEWLMRFINRPNNPPELKCKSAVSILISSEFLRMQRLVDECLQFVHDHINEVIKLPIDLNCINAGLVTRLSALFTVSELERIEDRRDKLRGKLWMKRVESLLEKPGNVLVCCAECGKVYCRRFQNELACSCAKPNIDFHGNVISRHVPLGAGQWKMRQYVHTLRSQRKMAWDVLYWRLWGMFHMFHCTVCGDAFPACEYNHCVFHPEVAKFGAGQNRGTYPCCGKEALRFDTTMRKSGCQARSHKVATLLSGSRPGFGASTPAVAGFGAVKGIVGVGISVPGSPKGEVSEEETTNRHVNDLIAHLDIVTIPFVSESTCGGYVDDRIAGLINGGAEGISEKSESVTGVKGGRRKSDSSVKSSSRSNRGNGTFSSSIPKRPGSSSNGNTIRAGRAGRPSTASGGRGSSSSSNGRYSSSGNSSGGSDFRNGIIGYNANSIGPDHMGQAGGISMSMAGKAVTTPEAFRVNPQRRSMWKLDLQREEDVVRMQALLQKLEKMRAPPEADEYTW